MTSRRTLLLFPFAAGLLATVAVAAPVPKDFDTAIKKWERLFGKTVPSAKGGEFQFHRTGLTAKMPAERFGNELVPHNGMHTQALVTGDFEVEVTLRVAADAIPLLPNKTVSLGGGLYVREPERRNSTRAVVAQALAGHGPRGATAAGWEREVISLIDGEDDYIDGAAADPSGRFHFRLTRTGDTFSTAVSPDGKEWKAFKARRMKLPETVAVGVFCYNRSGVAADVTFEGFALRASK